MMIVDVVIDESYTFDREAVREWYDSLPPESRVISTGWITE